MFTMYGDHLNMWLLNNIKTMQIYKFPHNPVLLLFVHQPDRLSGRCIANRLINIKQMPQNVSCFESMFSCILYIPLPIKATVTIPIVLLQTAQYGKDNRAHMHVPRLV